MNQLNCINYQNKKLTIEEIRNRVSMSKVEFANRIGITLATYNKKISNQSKWKLNELETIGKLFDLPVEQISISINELSCPKDCLSCAHSYSEPSKSGDILHCAERNWETVDEDYCCELYI